MILIGVGLLLVWVHLLARLGAGDLGGLAGLRAIRRGGTSRDGRSWNELEPLQRALYYYLVLTLPAAGFAILVGVLQEVV